MSPADAQQSAAPEPTREEIDAIREPAVIEFGAAYCGHCRAAQPLIAAAFALHPGVRRIKVEDGPGRRLGRSFRVKLWPTLIFLRQGAEVARLVRPAESGLIEEALRQIDAAATKGDS
ncbi:MAG: thioredoxin family protein [Sulfuritalea sp.]|nr:thioredoxin family protein [Sulfuritalea sp.]